MAVHSLCCGTDSERSFAPRDSSCILGDGQMEQRGKGGGCGPYVHKLLNLALLHALLKLTHLGLGESEGGESSSLAGVVSRDR